MKTSQRNARFGAVLVMIIAAALFTSCPDSGVDPLSNEALVTSFVFSAAANEALAEDVTATIDGLTVTATVPFGTDVTALAAAAEASVGAVITPDPADAADYTAPVTFTVTAEDTETTATYTVTVSVAAEDAAQDDEPIYTVSFDSRGGTAVADQTVAEGGLVTEPAEPVRSGFGLSGWYSDESLADRWVFASDTVHEDMTLYAGWSDLFADGFGTDGYIVWDGEGTSSSHDIGYDIIVDGDGSVFVTGYSSEGVNSLTENDMAIWKFGRDGVLDDGFGTGGTVFFDGGHGASYPNGDTGWGIALDDSGNIYVAGDSFLGNVYSSTWKYNAAGTAVSSFSDDGWAVESVRDETWAMDISVSGAGIIVVGYGWNYFGDDAYREDMYIMKYATSGTLDAAGFGTSGITTHNVSGTGAGSSHDRAYAAASAPDGGFYVTGHTYSSNYDMVIWKFDSDGVLDTGFNGTGFAVYSDAEGNDSEGKDLAVGSDGSIYVAGYLSNGTNNDMALWKYGPTGTPAADFGTGGIAISHGAAGGTGHDYGEGIVINDDGDIYVCGGSYNDEDTSTVDMTIWKYGSSGTPAADFGTGGVVSHNGASSGSDNPDEGYAIALDPAGNVYVCGQSSAGGSMDLAVWKYTSSGALAQ